MKTEEVTVDSVRSLYVKLDNKQMFIARFGTTKFQFVSQSILIDMYNYLSTRQR
jgi:hypothetical protein